MDYRTMRQQWARLPLAERQRIMDAARDKGMTVWDYMALYEEVYA